MVSETELNVIFLVDLTEEKEGDRKIGQNSNGEGRRSPRCKRRTKDLFGYVEPGQKAFLTGKGEKLCLP